MSDSPAGKNDKNRLRGSSLKAYSESKFWDNLKAKKITILSEVDKVDKDGVPYVTTTYRIDVEVQK